MEAGEELLDARDRMCPEPIRMAQARMEALSPGAVLRVLTTDPAAPIDLEAWCESRGHEFLGYRRVGGVWIICLRRSGP